MKTKTLLIAGAALAATIIYSEAQTVYSVNVAGYATVVIPGGGQFSLVANPFDDGNGNQLTNILASANLANKSQVITWNGTTYNGAITKGAAGWASSIPLLPGTGFFVKNAGVTTTNTFVGNVVVNSGSSGTNALATGFSLVGGQIPYVGDATTDTNINLVNAGLANKSQLIDWNVGSQNFDGAVTKGAAGWASSFPISVAQGFFIKNSGTGTNWTQSLQ